WIKWSMEQQRAEIPLEPMLCKKPIMSVHLGCSKEMLTVVSMLPVQNQALADQKKATFHQNKFTNPRCFENFIQTRSLLIALHLYKQFMETDSGHHGQATVLKQKVICSGFFRDAVKKEPWEGYFYNHWGSKHSHEQLSYIFTGASKMQQCLEPLYNRYEEPNV
uniref:Uncharacterized protein n=1 Tax=Oncorhynchus tshawytscha TaxID=74940 RepID=A0AAZ3QE77_ONCTS